jgi:hypothetical protein
MNPKRGLRSGKRRTAETNPSLASRFAQWLGVARDHSTLRPKWTLHALRAQPIVTEIRLRSEPDGEVKGDFATVVGEHRRVVAKKSADKMAVWSD